MNYAMTKYIYKLYLVDMNIKWREYGITRVSNVFRG